MHFHLPKPLHGWRELAGEVGIIVIGVLIALAAEQVVEDLRWQHRVRESLEALDGEIKDDYFSAAELVVTEPCVDAQLATVEQALSRPGAWSPPPVYTQGPLRFVVRSPTRTWGGNVWKSMLAEGVDSHVDRPLRLGIGAFYDTTAYLEERQTEAARLNWGLTAVGLPIDPGASERFRVTRDIEQMRGDFELMQLVANQALGRADSLGIGKEDPAKLAGFLEGSGTVRFCKAHHFPLGKLQPIAPEAIR